MVLYAHTISAHLRFDIGTHHILDSCHKRCQPNNSISLIGTTKQCQLHTRSTINNTTTNRPIQTRLLSSSSSSSNPTPTNTATANATKLKGNNKGYHSNASTKYFTTKTNQESSTCVETELAQLRAEIANLSYLIKQTASQQGETQALSRRAEARAYIIENKLMDIQSHVVKIPKLETMASNLRQTLGEYSPSYMSDAIRKVNESSFSFLTSKYTAWIMLGGIVMFWRYRLTMYQQTSEEIANVAAMTLQQDSLRNTIQETLTTVANSPETLASLSALFQKLISDERTEQHLINLIVRALKSEGVRDAAIYLLDVCFQNPDLQSRAGEFLKVAANATVLDEGVQKNAGVGIQQALKSAVLPWWAKNHISGDNGNSSSTVKAGSDTDSTADPVNSENAHDHIHMQAETDVKKTAGSDTGDRNNNGTEATSNDTAKDS